MSGISGFTLLTVYLYFVFFYLAAFKRHYALHLAIAPEFFYCSYLCLFYVCSLGCWNKICVYVYRSSKRAITADWRRWTLRAWWTSPSLVQRRSAALSQWSSSPVSARCLRAGPFATTHTCIDVSLTDPPGNFITNNNSLSTLAAVLTATQEDIAAATQRITVTHAGYFLYNFAGNSRRCVRNCPFSERIWIPT